MQTLLIPVWDYNTVWLPRTKKLFLFLEVFILTPKIQWNVAALGSAPKGAGKSTLWLW